jgi:hypothetical protein
MGKLVLVIVICIFQFLGSKNVSAQQFLWATSSKGITVNSGIKIINLQDVHKEILGYYEMYDYYYDLSGFSKEGYFEKYESSNSFKTTDKLKWNEFKKTVNGINELTVSCIKTNDGNTSSVSIFIYSKNNFDAIVFSNKIEPGRIHTYNSNSALDKSRFLKYLESLLGKGNVPSEIEGSSAKDDYNKAFTIVQIPAEFPGGLPSWSKYLERNLNRNLPKGNGASPGKYTVNVSFKVDKNGGIYDVKAENDPGYGTKEEAERVIKAGPSWKPAVQNGRNVDCFQTVAITFMITED